MLKGALELFLISTGLTYFLGAARGGLRLLGAPRLSSGHPGARSAAGSRAARGAGSHRRPRDPGPVAETLNPGLRRWRRVRLHLATAEQPPARAGVVIDPADCVVYFVLPCRNAGQIISESVRGLLADPRCLVVVVDDGSQDRTGDLAAAVAPGRVLVVRRGRAGGRPGRAAAVSLGFAAVRLDAAMRGIAASRVSICVLDAQARLSPGAMDAVLPLFADQQLGAVQLPVRMRDRTSLPAMLQDIEFWSADAAARLGRISAGTLSLAGNGLFTRLAAMLEISAHAGQGRLADDLDFALALAAAGWRVTSTPQGYVSLPGAGSVRALIRQRTRWYRGHLRAARWLPALWSSRQLSHLGLVELAMYLLAPWLLVLPWSVAFNYNLLMVICRAAGWGSLPVLGSAALQRGAALAFWYCLSSAPILVAGYLYDRRRPAVSLVRSVLLVPLLLLGNYVTYLSCWLGCLRLLAGALRREGRSPAQAKQQEPQPPADGQAGRAYGGMSGLVPAPRPAGLGELLPSAGRPGRVPVAAGQRFGGLPPHQ